MGIAKRGLAGFLSLSIALSSVPALGADQAPVSQAPKSPTVLEIACGPNGNPESCVYLSAWHWFRKARVIIDPAIQTIKVSSAVWTMAVIAKMIGGDAPIIEYTLTISSAGARAGGILLLTGAVAVVIGTIVSAGGFLLAMITPAGDYRDDHPPGCAEMIAPYNSPDGLQKLLQLPQPYFEEIVRCIPPDSELGRFVQKTARDARILEQQLH